MKCEYVESVIIDYLDKTLGKEEHDQIEEHLATCERCLDQVKDLQHLLKTAETTKPELPDESLRTNFYHMLQGEVNKQALEENRTEGYRTLPGRSSWLLYIAAGFGLLITGALLGMIITGRIGKSESNARITELQQEVKVMKEMVMISMLKEESPSQRLQAVGYVQDMQSPDAKILDALVTTLNHDKNVNVRLAAAYSLAKYADNLSVRDSLLKSLPRQTEPIIQVVLINILVEKRETRAVESIQEIISNGNTLEDVKDVAKKGIDILL